MWLSLDGLKSGVGSCWEIRSAHSGLGVITGETGSRKGEPRKQVTSRGGTAWRKYWEENIWDDKVSSRNLENEIWRMFIRYGSW